MDQQQLLQILFLFIFAPGGYFLYTYLFPKSILPRASTQEPDNPSANQQTPGDSGNSQFQRAGYRGSFATERDTLPPLEEKLFRAGYMREEDRLIFRCVQIIAPVVGFIVVGYFTAYMKPLFHFVGFALGAYLGYFIPRFFLDRAIANRDEEIMYYLPLVIEQFVIGVGSGLDIGPCIHRVVAVSDERDTHNPVTELLKNALLLTRSGTPLDEALEEIAVLAGHTELKHSFMTMGQASRHGGELTRQLQELANAVSNQRETRVEARIKKLELVATGPVVLVFVSFMAILFMGVGIQVMKAFSV